MISIIYCTREHNQKHIDHLKKVGGHPKVEVIEYINNGEGLTKFYNKGLEESKFDIVVFCHDDIEIESKQIAKKLIRHYENSDYGILGVAGTKELSETGRWWDNRKAMYGRVWHTHNGKKTLSKYSHDLEKSVEEVVVVDGVFFSVMKSRLKETFNPDVKGFHFYDVDFCFRNYLKDIKIGVHTDIVINHMSIGETNDEWEINRGMFAEKYKGDLPIKINRVFTDTDSFNILIGASSINEIIPLAEKLRELNHRVTVASQPTSDVIQLKKIGARFFPLNDPIGYKIGDGKWGVNNVVSEKDKLYKFNVVDFDVLHVNDGQVKDYLVKLYPEILPASVNDEMSLDDILDEYKTILL